MRRYRLDLARIAPMLGEVAAGASLFSAAMYYAVAVPSSQVFGPAVVRGARGKGCVALTFDDGPSESTPALLDVLAGHGAHATFFSCGANALRLPEVARRVAAEGHEIGNHTFQHPRLYRLVPRRIEEEIGAAQVALRQVVGRTPDLFRPPYGIRWFGLYPAVGRHGLRVVMWSACVFDWRRPAEAIEAGLRQKATDGAIVLLHDGDGTEPGDRRAATVRALERVLPLLAQRGLRCVTVSELLS